MTKCVGQDIIFITKYVGKDNIFTWTTTMASVKPLHCNMCNGYLQERVIEVIHRMSDLCLQMSSCVHWPEKGKSSNRKKALCFPSCQVRHPWTLHCYPIISVTNDSHHNLQCTELILFSMVTIELKLKTGAFEAKLNNKLLLNYRRGLLKHFFC